MDGVNGVIGIGRELIGVLAVGFVISLYKRGRFVIGSRSGERSHQHDILGQTRVEVLHRHQTIQTVAAKEHRLIADLVSLRQNQGRLGVVNGQEHQLCACRLGLLNLDCEVLIAVGGKRLVGNDLQALFLRLGHERIVNAGGIRVRTVIDDGDLCRKAVLNDIIGGKRALLRVGEANAERIVVCDAAFSGAGRRQLEHIVVCRLGRNGDAGIAGDGAHQDLHAPVLQAVVRVDRLLGIVLVILEFHLILLAAQRVDLGNGDLRAVLHGIACNRADTADLNGRAGTRRAAGRRGGRRCAGAGTAARRQRKGEAEGQRCAQKLFHTFFLQCFKLSIHKASNKAFDRN